jgi:hypothetical protein
MPALRCGLSTAIPAASAHFAIKKAELTSSSSSMANPPDNYLDQARLLKGYGMQNDDSNQSTVSLTYGNETIPEFHCKCEACVQLRTPTLASVSLVPSNKFQLNIS